ncbi:D-arginine dehydrogenase [Pseudooceanicola antarcticus]|uniref:D-arginine dehydrogenase n=1 Tax=Pseudooceanicola antarcticus TaxID=1247613 RepID=A0A285HVW9_9RHOB|nr:FAD-binding oxidoreductase [Pseudooceanicola antarcticus]PJE27423.1 FAD-binding oxidoreductase [Pseudooceanicola antarcticus]SNY39807.1 D-arginine dehydrogenase [Pseudooceanicola antarcticus]
MQKSYDVLVVGAGIAGLSLAAALSETARVAVLEREAGPGRHASGRAAALLRLLHSHDELRGLTEASLPFLMDRHPEIDGAPLLKSRGLLLLAREDQLPLMSHVETRARGLLRRLDRQDLLTLVPQLRYGYAGGALIEEGARDIDVPRLMEVFRRRFAAHGGDLYCSAEVSDMWRQDGLWRVQSAAGPFSAPVVVNAAGAWADGLARMAGVAPIGIDAMRRTVLEVEVREAERLAELPMIVDMDMHFYLKPEGGMVLLSPADETSAKPGDVVHEDLDVTLCLDRIRACFDLEILDVKRIWAGLRSYAPDRMPVLGFDAGRPGFYWLAAQGSSGIQTAPAVARFAAAQITGSAAVLPGADLQQLERRVSPARFAEAAL